MWTTSSPSEMRAASRARTHASVSGVEAKLEYGFLDAVAPGFQCFGDAQPPLIVGDVVGDDVDHRQATPLHW